MAGEVSGALVRIAGKLGDKSVDKASKLKILKKLDEVTATLSQLSDTGIVRALRRFKSEPDEIGLRARCLLEKWRTCLEEHMERDLNNKNEKNESKQKDHLKEKKPTCANESGLRIPSQTLVPKLLKKRPLPEPISPSLDASSGLSFEEAMSMSVPVKKKAKKCSKLAAQPSTSNSGGKQNHWVDESKCPSRTFTEEILQSLADPFERPDVQKKPTPRSSQPSTSFDNPEDNGSLKFNSKMVIWAPRIRRSVENGTNGHASLTPTGGSHNATVSSPPKLLNLCLAVLSKNISMIDHVGLVPYELLSRVLNDASPEDLLRIERCNPQFHGMTNDLWKRHVHLRFPQESKTIKGPGKRETWFDLYERLSAESKHRLKDFINRSADKLRAEQESSRKTLMVEAITPSQIERRANRMMNCHRGTGAHHRRQNGSYSSTSRESANSKMVFKPRNMSYPSPPPRDVAGSSSTVPDSQNGSGRGRPNGSMLQKLRKQFLRGK
ncbi:hypothetical protein Aperf_G00000073900 [Anoplocephala perfoliata]